MDDYGGGLAHTPGGGVAPGSDLMDALVRELALSSPWSLEYAKRAVAACEAKGLSVEDARRVCEFSLQSGLLVGAVLDAIDIVGPLGPSLPGTAGM